jgi:hypothetical protein
VKFLLVNRKSLYEAEMVVGHGNDKKEGFVWTNAGTERHWYVENAAKSSELRENGWEERTGKL